ncbi:MAG: metalloregulator ArsR/SmtB family transcription factor [Anaerolineales bacterium]|jgi:ArsR family transcriptional regulator|nr:metalloregulator ArsR/SmtB family transcription factor [Anaerolineales bacterium]
MTNMIIQSPTAALSTLFQTLGVAPRLEILLAIGESEACVCHLEAILGYRQAFISQHLMALREADLLETRRNGRYIYYRLADRRLLNMLAQAGEMLGEALITQPLAMVSCECPNCAPAKQGSSAANHLTLIDPERVR